MPAPQRLQTKDEAQLERLFDLLPNDYYDIVKLLPHSKRALVERWYETEADRLSPIMRRVAGGLQHQTPAIMELLDMLAAAPINLQAAGSWLAKHRNELSAQLLAELVSAAMGRGVIDLMSQRAGKRQEANREKKAEALRLWEQDFKAQKNMSKSKAAPRIAEAVGLAESTVRRLLRGI